MVLPVLSIYGDDLTGANTALLGLALGIYGLTQAVLQIPFGMASDKFGRKKILIIGFLLFIVGSLICAQAESAYQLIFGRAIQGAGAVSAVLLALVGDLISEKNRTTSMAIIGASIGLSFGLSVVLAPIVAEVFFGLKSIFYLAAILGVIALLMTVFSIQNANFSTSKQSNRVKPLKEKGYFSSVLTANLLRLDLSIFVLHFIQMCIWIAVPIVLLKELSISPEDHWLVYLITVGGSFILMAPFMRVFDKAGIVKGALLIAISVILASLLVMSHISKYGFFLVGLFCFFWGFNLLEATLPSTLTKLVRPEAKGLASGIYSSCQFLGVFLGGLCGGIISSYYGLTAVFYLSAVLVFVWLLVMLPSKSLSSSS